MEYLWKSANTWLPAPSEENSNDFLDTPSKHYIFRFKAEQLKPFHSPAFGCLVKLDSNVSWHYETI